MRNAIALLLTLLASPAFADQAWGPLPNAFADQAWMPLPNADGTVSAGFVHYDGGGLIVICDVGRHYLMMGLAEPRANWQRGQQVKFMTHPDTGANLDDTAGTAMSKNYVMIGDETTSTWHLNAMGRATVFFGIYTGDHLAGPIRYARVFPAPGFREAMEPVLKACGDHW